MTSPQITFRLTKYQLALGLAAIRKFESSYKIENINKMVKNIVIDYIAKFGPTNDSTLSMDEITSMIEATKKARKSKITLNSIIEKETQKETQPEAQSKAQDQTKAQTESTITTVNDFSIPEDWNLE